MTQRDFNAAIGILGMFILGIFLDWFPKTILEIPMPGGNTMQFMSSAVWQTVATIVIPVYWAIKRLDISLADLGLNTQNLGKTLVLGCGLYTLALAAFIYSAEGSMIANHAVGKVGLWDAIGLTSGMCLIAAGTDVATRGFLLLGLARYTHVSFAIIIQNLAWYVGHIHEIKLLSDSLTFAGAIALTLTLGILGDVIALKTRNIVGLAIAHILLNIIMTTYIRY